MCAANFLALIPEIFLGFSTCLLIVFGVISFPLSVYAFNFSDNNFEFVLNKRRLFKIKQFNINSEISRSLVSVRDTFFRVGFLSLIILLLTGCLCINFNSFVSVSFFFIDGYSTLIKLLVVSISFFLLVIILGSKKPPFIFETFIFILVAILGLFFLISSYDLLIFYLSLELQSFSLFILASLNRTSEFSTEAGLKYFVLGAFSSGLILFGCSFLYGFSGITNFGALQLIFSSISLDFISLFSNAGFCLGFVFILVGLLFKIGAAPFHMWIPDVYEGVPLYITAFFAIVPKIVLFGFLLRFILCVSFGFSNYYFSATNFSLSVQLILCMCSVGSLTVGTFGGLFQKKIKRLLAYSAIAHVGYILLGFIVGSVEGVQAVFIYLFFYLSSSLGIFALLLSLRFIFCSTLKGGAWPKTNTHNKIYFFTPIFITDLLFLLRGNKLLSLSFLTFIFSMAGIPPLAGFYGKLYLFFSCLSAELYSLVVFSVVMSVISCFYYLRLIKFVYFSSLASSKFVDRIYSFKINTYSSFIIAFIFLFISGFVFYPGPVLYVAHFLAIELIS